MKRKIIIWLVCLGIGAIIGLAAKYVIDSLYTDAAGDIGVWLAIPVFILCAGLLPLGYMFARKIEGD